MWSHLESSHLFGDASNRLLRGTTEPMWLIEKVVSTRLATIWLPRLELLIIAASYRFLLAALDRHLAAWSQHFCIAQVTHYRLGVHHVCAVLALCHISEVHQTTHTSCHVFLLHPFWIHGASFSLSLFPCLEDSLVLVVALTTLASVDRVKPLTLVPTAGLLLAQAFTVRLVILARVLAEALKILTAEDRDVSKHLAFAPG